MKDEWPWTSEHYIPLASADRDYLPTDSGEGYPAVSKKEVARLWAERKEDGLRWEIAWAEVSHLYN